MGGWLRGWGEKVVGEGGMGGWGEKVGGEGVLIGCVAAHLASPPHSHTRYCSRCCCRCPIDCGLWRLNRLWREEGALIKWVKGRVIGCVNRVGERGC